MWLFGHLFNMSYVIWSSGHLVIWSSGQYFIWSSGFLVIWSFPILWKTLLFWWNTWIICGYSESCFGDLIEQSGYLVYASYTYLLAILILGSRTSGSTYLHLSLFCTRANVCDNHWLDWKVNFSGYPKSGIYVHVHNSVLHEECFLHLVLGSSWSTWTFTI